MKRFLLMSLLLAVAACGDTGTGPVDLSHIDIPAPSFSLITVVPSVIPGSTYACAQPATATGSGGFASSAQNAINCDATYLNQANHGSRNNAWLTVDFDSPRTFSGLHVTMHALPDADETYTIYGTPTGGSEVQLGQQRLFVKDGRFPNPTEGLSQHDFDFGLGFQEYTSIRITITDVSSSSWIAVNGIELIVEGVPIDTDGDGVPDVDDAYPNSDLAALVTIGQCSTGVTNQSLTDGSTFNDLIGTAKDSAKNHGKFVSAVSSLADGWKKAGLISGRDQGRIVSCAARSR